MRSRKILISLGVIILTGIVVAAILIHRGSSQAPKADSAPSKEVMAVIDKYMQARENSVGADQSSPTTWLDTVKPVVTAAWLKHLQPSANPSTSNISYAYTYAHQKGYTVKAVITNCYWTGVYGKPSKDGGSVLCSLSDETIDQATGQTIPASSLQFGWVYTGRQQPPLLVLVKQDGKWLISEDDTGQGQ